MYNNKSLILIFITFFFTSIYGVYSQEIMSKEEVLKLKDKSNSFYCKDDICSKYHMENTIDIPNKEGNMINYIIDICSTIENDLGQCKTEKCTAYSQCLSNKCINNHCVFNEVTPVVFCKMINLITSKEMRCGKPFGESCKIDNDCTSNKCGNGFCEEERYKIDSDYEHNKIKYEPMSKEEVLKIDDQDGSITPEFYCKDNICYQKFDNEVDLQDKQGNKTSYIADTCNTASIESNYCYSKKCIFDSQCLSNKCINRHCTFNENIPLEHCAVVTYALPFFGQDKKMRCGKANGEICDSNNECTTKNCEHKICDYDSTGDSRMMTEAMGKALLGIVAFL
ncbi:hypothetical protein BCR32DRAFT_297369 [Anaeromyces robustus]|uniref:Dickkopf N-terminal cysteine-rich domain-containing protein n=1 Tax=Anaeromyces robustus TaxID=1754192 RepID=A0A1Y1WAK5_9FUNG|nr:hypothetical protein BCR32DRAFT_297369 [Anaeromyces robustus]|eukprot:ORX70405.1 hypothetical protein BCR32DRAFT_297369 [Anaeromyces robustus]